MFSDYLLETGAPHDVVVVDGDTRYTYAQLRRAAGCIVAALTDAGVEPGSRIAVLGPNSFFWLAAYLAALKFGVAVPLSDKATSAEINAQTSWAGCDVLLAPRSALRRLAPLPQCAHIITEEVLHEPWSPAWPDREVSADSDATLMFTSGTTARPKAVRLTQANLLANTAAIIEYLQLRGTDRILVILPFHYVFGASLLHTHLAVGGSLVLCHTFAYPQSAVDLIAQHGCTGMAGVPSSYQLLLKASNYSTQRLPTLKVVQQAGGRLAPELIHKLAAAQPTSRVFIMYGQTEATARLSYLPPEFLADKPGSIGRGIPGVRLTVEDGLGRQVAPGEQGEIIANGPSISPGYLKDEEASRAKFRSGRLHTGDLATVDQDGFIFIVGRSGDFIKSWGHRISPQQIEEAALLHNAVSLAVAVGIPDDEAGEVVHLVVSRATAEPAEAAEILAFLRSKLPRHIVPKRVHVMENIPLTASGKVSRNAIRDLVSRLV